MVLVNNYAHRFVSQYKHPLLDLCGAHGPPRAGEAAAPFAVAQRTWNTGEREETQQSYHQVQST